jgi:nucleoside diphosphate kinase
MTSRPIVEKVIESPSLVQQLPELQPAADPVRALQGAIVVEPRRAIGQILASRAGSWGS